MLSMKDNPFLYTATASGAAVSNEPPEALIIMTLAFVCGVLALALVLAVAYIIVGKLRRRRRAAEEGPARELTADLLMAKRASTDAEIDVGGSADSFHSCHGEELERAIAPKNRTQVRTSVSCMSGSMSINSNLISDDLQTLANREERKRRKRQNANLVTQYAWLEGLMRDIVECNAGNIECIDRETNQGCLPLFVVAGVCPSKVPPSPMQAVLFVEKDGEIDFWFVKPDAANPKNLQKETLCKHAKGPFKNAAERSKNLYAPLAAKFKGVTEGNFTFGVANDGRAFIQETTDDGRHYKMYPYFVWLESWSSALASKKFLEGKICYGQSSRTKQYLARQFRIEDGSIHLEPWTEQEEVRSLMPGKNFQEMMI